MSLLDTINSKITESMKSGDKFALDVLRMAKTTLQNATILKHDHVLSPDEEIGLMQKEAKKRREAAATYRFGQRPELADKEDREADFLAQFLPKQASDEEIEKIVSAALAQTAATTRQDMGKVMGVVMPQLKGTADPGRVSAVVMRHLT